MNNEEPVSTIDKAIEQVTTVLDDIEDLYSGEPNNPSNWDKGQRMYLPDFGIQGAWKITDDYKRVDLASNYFYFHADGSMACAARKTAIVKWTKEGANSCEAPKEGEVHPDKDTWVEAEERDISTIAPTDWWNQTSSSEQEDDSVGIKPLNLPKDEYDDVEFPSLTEAKPESKIRMLIKKLFGIGSKK